MVETKVQIELLERNCPQWSACMTMLFTSNIAGSCPFTDERQKHYHMSPLLWLAAHI